MTEASSPSDRTRDSLIAAGIRLFGRQGFAATSVRQLANEAGANIAAITYHFGGKEGLRLACAEDFGRRMSAAMAAAQVSAEPSPLMARNEVKAFIRAMARFLIGAEGASELVPFMLRELSEDGPGLDTVYRKFAEPVHRRLCWLWGTATGTEPESEAVRLAVFSVIGQIFYFRIGQPVVSRRMGWETVGPTEIDLITARIIATLDALLDAGKGA